MSVVFRDAVKADIPAVLALLQDDMLGAGREVDDLGVYERAFDQMAAEGTNVLVVGERDGVVVATYQLTLIAGLSLRAARRANVESVRVASHLRGQGIGAEMMADAEARARAAGAALMQLTANAKRERAHAFYQSNGFVKSHVGFKKDF